MERKEPRWHMLWFFTSGMWLIIFCANIFYNRKLSLIAAIQFADAVVSFAAGVVNAKRYRKRILAGRKDMP